MKAFSTLFRLGVACVLLGLALPLAKAAEVERPNFIIIFCDDLGYADIGPFGSENHRTPNLDRMAAEGIKFTDAHSPSTICSPSRYGLYSGQQVYRTGRGSSAFEGPGGPSYLKPGELTIAEMVKKQGYRTGVFGKWHVGLTWYDKSGKRLGGGFKNSLLIDYERSTPLEDGPNKRGFDESFVTPNCPTTDPLYIYIENGMVPVPASERHKRDKVPNPGGKWRWDNDEGWMSPDYRFVDADLLFYDKTLEFITKHRKNTPEKPFFVVFSTQISHAPVLPAPEFNGKTKGGPRGDFIHELDVLTGRLLDAIKRLGIDENTLIMFNSDNGPETVHTDWMRQDHDHDAAGGYRGMKRDGWEGGHRGPFIARWPDRIPAGKTSNHTIAFADVLATLADAAGRPKLPQDAAGDSVSFLPVLLHPDQKHKPRPPILHGGRVIRAGDWKLINTKGGRGFGANRKTQYGIELYNLKDDLSEKNNLADKMPEKVESLQAKMRSILEN